MRGCDSVASRTISGKNPAGSIFTPHFHVCFTEHDLLMAYNTAVPVQGQALTGTGISILRVQKMNSATLAIPGPGHGTAARRSSRVVICALRGVAVGDGVRPIVAAAWSVRGSSPCNRTSRRSPTGSGLTQAKRRRAARKRWSMTRRRWDSNAHRDRPDRSSPTSGPSSTA
jgi:hypothetical protein